MPGQIRVFIASSLDGFIAGTDGDLSWLPPFQPGQDYGYAEHMAETAAILMGRASYDAVQGFDGPWPYGDTPVYVATNRPLGELPADALREVDGEQVPSVKAVSGEPVDLIAAVQAEIGDGGIYVDGGALIRSVLDAGLVDELVVTLIPVILGAGLPLFAGAARRHELELVHAEAYDDGLVQVRYEVKF
ncbi:MAG: dihydrofolate reductase family protein [Solirubrobacteraceae bacterium]|nr:dihydrofolate reductase family protein [Solirubrobacteraceae bacterium]